MFGMFETGQGGPGKLKSIAEQIAALKVEAKGAGGTRGEALRARIQRLEKERMRR